MIWAPSAWRYPGRIPVAASISLRIRRNRIWTGHTRFLRASWAVAPFSTPSARAIASGVSINDSRSGFSLCHSLGDRTPIIAACAVWLLRPEQDSVPPLRLARVARRARRSLLLSGRRRARPRGAGVRRGELRLARAALQPRGHPAHSPDCVRLALGLRADKRPAVHSPRGAAGGDRVPEASRGVAVPRQLRRVSPYDPPRAGARVPAQHHDRSLRPLPAHPPGRNAAVVDRRARRILFGRRRHA